MGLVSVIIPVYNQPTLIQACIESVVAQRYRKYELIVVDDGSTDQTHSVLTALAEEYSELRLFKQVHQGSAAARETGRLNARGEFIQYLNCFERIGPEKLSSQLAAFSLAPDVNIVCGVGSFSIDQVDTPWSNGAMVFLFPALLTTRCWRTGAPLYRREFIDQLGPWLDLKADETHEYEARMASAGAVVLLIEESTSSRVSEVAELSSTPLDTPILLAERCRAYARVFQLAQAYTKHEDTPNQISAEDWSNYSSTLFDFARHCALHGMTTEARAMLTLSIEANGRKSPKHRLFIKLVGWFGWRAAARLFQRRV
ncbi:glycosyl transferase family 2 [Arenicella xantha]|uniref:Glycosyl transferase family 2 n=2 Tax=Arenicella xantha TaxID=644221 RepID=A0A395JPK5_9GAMM|nr:glycosyl transferase family 2 [Arenicella xantha]